MIITRNYRKVRAQPVINEPGVTVRWLVSEQDNGPNFALRLYEMEPGATTTTNTHYWEREVFVLHGRGTVVGEQGEIPLNEGDVVYVPPAERHQFANKGDEVLRLLMVLPIPQRTAL